MHPFFALTVPRRFYPFRFIDSVTGKWKRARYVADLHVIAERYAEWEIVGPPEIRSRRSAGMFSPWAKLAPRPAQVPVKEPPPDEEPPTKEPPSREPPVKEPPPLDPPALHEIERFFVLVFLRRYITYCTRRRKFAEMNGAAKLFRKVIAR